MIDDGLRIDSSPENNDLHLVRWIILLIAENSIVEAFKGM